MVYITVQNSSESCVDWFTTKAELITTHNEITSIPSADHILYAMQLYLTYVKSTNKTVLNRLRIGSGLNGAMTSQ